MTGALHDYNYAARYHAAHLYGMFDGKKERVASRVVIVRVRDKLRAIRTPREAAG